MDIKGLLENASNCSDPDDSLVRDAIFMGGSFLGIWIFAFFAGVNEIPRGWIGDHLHLVLLSFIFPGLLGAYLYTRFDKKRKERLSMTVLRLIKDPTFTSETSRVIAEALRQRKKVYPISGTRTIQNGETVDEIIEIGESLVEPEHSEDEGKFAHLYRCLTTEAKEALAKACPLITETRISTIRTPGALGHEPGTRELR